MRAESFRANKQLKAFARSRSGGTFAKYAPITTALRKGSGYGPWFARFSRYFVDPEKTRAKFGILSKEDAEYGVRRFQPISGSFASSARLQAKGYTFRQTRKRQRQQAKLLMHSTKISTRRRALRHLKKTGGSWSRLIPRIGIHRVPARPIVEPFLRMEKQRIVRNLRKLYRLKYRGIRFSKNWATEWGNK